VFRRCIGANRFLVHMEFLERQNRQSIDHHPRRFRVSRATRGRRLQRGHDDFVHLFDEVIPLLVESIDVSFSAVHRLETQVISTSYVLLVPQLKVSQMILLNEQNERIADGLR